MLHCTRYTKEGAYNRVRACRLERSRTVTGAVRLPSAARVEGVAEPIADEVHREDGDGDGDAWEDDGVLAGHEDPVAAPEGVGEHRAPLGRRRAGTEAQEGEGCHVEDGCS